jgi:HSP20 family protein
MTMRNVARWNPTREAMDLFNEFERLLGRSAYRDAVDTPTTWGLALDVFEQDEVYVVKASVPGVNPDDLNITLEDNVLTIQGELQAEESIEEGQYHLRERRYGSFGRTLRFPVAVNANAVTANYENGVLTLSVPKAEEVKPKRIAINANGS